MKKESLADKLAKKSFESSTMQHSWQIHMQAFGPILEPAFEGNYQAKVHLTAALNYISKFDFAKGLSKLQQVTKYCETDADKTAYLFFVGLCCEMAGDREQMVELYMQANEYEHGFYLPYLKVAKFYHENCAYDIAEENYCAAIECLANIGRNEQEKVIVGSAYMNMASCLTMMHRYDEAKTALELSSRANPNSPDRAAVEALLYAVCGNAEQAQECLDKVKKEVSSLYDSIKISVEKVLDGTNPMFFPVTVDEDKITQFWKWFGEYSFELRAMLRREEFEQGIAPVAEKLLETFPFMEETPYIAIGENEQGYVLELKDMYSVAVINAYEKLMQGCPEKIRTYWQFAVIH